jgi:hypothetical protein
MVTDKPDRAGLELGIVELGHDTHPSSQGSGIKPVTVHYRVTSAHP